jgi:8-oxo-dGTP pyrophosphatase MutT (NUDIX family)
MNKKGSSIEYCSNCGNEGHLFRDCTSPVMSYGIIAIKYSSDDLNRKSKSLCSTKSLITGIDETSSLQFLLIQRKDSLNFVEFIRGKYDVTDISYIERMFRNMTIAEQERILFLDFDGLWRSVWGRGSKSHRSEFESSWVKYNRIRNLLPGIIQKNRSTWTEPEWGFPKGRRNYQENDISCAIREFVEETGLSKNSFRIIENILPVTEKFFGSNHVHYCHKYYIAICYPDIEVSMNYNNETMTKEIGDIRWLTHEQALAKIRPDNIEKREILLNVVKILKNFLPFIPNTIQKNMIISRNTSYEIEAKDKKIKKDSNIEIHSEIHSEIYSEIHSENHINNLEKCLVVL